MALRWNEGKSAHGYGKRKSPRPGGGQNASMPPSKWTYPRERMPATANTSYAVPQRRSRRRLAGSPKPPMESRQAHSIHGVALSKASSRPRCATRGIPAPRCRARPAHNAAQSHQQRRRAQATPPMAPARGRSGCPKTEIRPKLQLFCDCELPRGVKTRIDARKSGKSDAQRPISASRRTERSPQSQKSCTEVGIFVSAKRIVVTEQFLRKTRVPSMPIRPSSSTEPQGIDHASTHALTLGKNPALARLKNATSEEKRWAK